MESGARPTARILPMLTVKSEEKQTTSRDVSRNSANILAVFIQKFNEIKNEQSYCTPIYTDGSKDNDRVGYGTIIDNSSFKQRLPSNASIFTAEVTAIDLALDAITESDDDHFIIFSD